MRISRARTQTVLRPFSSLVLPAPLEARRLCRAPAAANAMPAEGERAKEPYQMPFVEPTEPRLPRPKIGGSLGLNPLTVEERRFRDELLWLPVVYDPPERGCENVPRPCQFVRCKHNNYLDRTSSGAATLNFPDLEPHQMDPKRSCSIDVAMRGGASLAEVGKAIGLTMERIRQVELEALEKLKGTPLLRDLERDAEKKPKRRKRAR